MESPLTPDEEMTAKDFGRAGGEYVDSLAISSGQGSRTQIKTYQTLTESLYATLSSFSILLHMMWEKVFWAVDSPKGQTEGGKDGLRSRLKYKQIYN